MFQANDSDEGLHQLLNLLTVAIYIISLMNKSLKVIYLIKVIIFQCYFFFLHSEVHGLH